MVKFKVTVMKTQGAEFGENNRYFSPSAHNNTKLLFYRFL